MNEQKAAKPLFVECLSAGYGGEVSCRKVFLTFGETSVVRLLCVLHSTGGSCHPWISLPSMEGQGPPVECIMCFSVQNTV